MKRFRSKRVLNNFLAGKHNAREWQKRGKFATHYLTVLEGIEFVSYEEAYIRSMHDRIGYLDDLHSVDIEELCEQLQRKVDE